MEDKVFQVISINKREMFPIVDITIQSDYSEEIVSRILLKLAFTFIDLADQFGGRLFGGEPLNEVTRVFGIRFGLIFPNIKVMDDYVVDIIKTLGPTDS